MRKQEMKPADNEAVLDDMFGVSKPKGAPSPAGEGAGVKMMSFRLDAALARRLKIHAAETGQTALSVVDAALRAWLDAHEGKQSA